MNIKDERIGVILAIVSISLVIFVVGSIWYMVNQIPQESLDENMNITYGDFFELTLYIMLLVIMLSIISIASTDEIINYIKKRIKK